MIKNLHFTRSLTRSLAIAALAIFILMPGRGWGQIVAWESNGLTGGGTAPWSATTIASNIQGTPQITVGSGCNPAGGTPPGNAFVRTAMTSANQAGAISGNDYFQFSIGPSSGYKISYTTIDANFRRTTNGANNFIFQYSLDGFATAGIDIGSSNTYVSQTNGVAITQIILSAISSLQNVTGTVTFRIYWWGESGTTQNAGIGRLPGNDLAIGGTIASACTPPSAPSTTNGSVCNSGTVALTASGALAGEDYKWYDASTGGTLKQLDGSTYTTPSISTTTSYYATIYNTTTLCESASRAQATATVVSSATSVGPTFTQNIGPSVNGAKLTVTEGSTPTSRVWKYGTLSGTYTTSIANTTTDYYPNFAGAGTYFVVCETTYPSPCGVVTSNEVQVNVVSDAITLTTSPQNFGPFCNASDNSVNLTYTTTGTVTAPFIELSNSSGSFATGTNNIGGTVTGTGPYTITANIPAAQAAGTYRIRVKSTDGTPVISADNGSDITVNTAVTPTVTVSASPACAGTTLTFTATISNGGTTPHYQWKKNTGTGYVNAGSDSPSYAPTAGTQISDGNLIECILTSNASCITSANATSNEFVAVVNVVPDAVIVSGAGTFCESTTLTATGGTNGTIYWQNTTNNGTSTSTVSSSQSVSSAGTYYFRSYSGTCWGTQGSAAVTINTIPVIGTQPANKTVTEPATATFTVSGTGTISGYQWQINTGSGWADVTDGTGGTTTSYTTSATLISMTGYQYRCIVKGTAPCTDVTSSIVSLTVNAVACGGTESFTNANLPTSSGDGSFSGDAVSWSYVSCRAEDAFGITGKGCMLGTTSSAKITSGSLSGIGNFTCKLKKGFTGTGTRQVALYINGVLKGNSIAWDNTTTQTFSVNNINISGAIVIEIRNLTSFYAVIDDISWTCYNPPVAPTALSATSVNSSDFTAIWNTVSGATGYKLDVSPVNPIYSTSTVLLENCSGFSAGSHNSPNGSAINGSLNAYTQVTGWTGTQVYSAGGEIKMGSGSAVGIVTTPTIDLLSTTVSLSFDLQDYGDGSTVEVLHAPDGITFNTVTTIVSPATKTNQVVNITGGTALSKLKIQSISTSKARYFLDNIQVTKAVNNSLTGYNDLSVAGTTQIVTGLTANTNYYYQVRAVGANGTSANSDVISVTTDSKPTAFNMTGGGAYCAGGTEVAVGLSNSQLGVSYTLIKNGSPTATVIAGTGAAFSFGVQPNGTYTASGFADGSGTIDGTTAMTGSASVTENPLPTPTFTLQPGANSCVSSDVTYTTEASKSSYVWTYPGSTLNTDYTITTGGTSTDNTVTLKWLTTGAKTVGVNYSTTGCTAASATESNATTVNALPTAYNVTGGGSYCIEGTGRLVGLEDSDLGINYELYADGITTGEVVAGTGTNIAFATPQTAVGTYTVVAKNATTNCTQNMTGSVSISTNPLPTAAIALSGPTTFCAGGSVTLTASGGTSYSWSSSQTTAAITVSVGGTYSVLVTDANGCEAVAAAPLVVVNPLPVAPTSVVSSDDNYCQNSTSEYITLTSTGGSGVTQKWFTGSCGGTLIGSGNFGTPILAPAVTTTYYTYWENGCGISECANVTVTVKPLPTAPTVTTPVQYCLNAAATPLTATGTSLLWYTAATGGTGISAAPTPSTASAGSTSYWVSQTGSGCESSRAEIVVTVTGAPTVDAGTDQFVATGVAYPIIEATASNATSYLWAVTGGTGSGTFDHINWLNPEFTSSGGGRATLKLTGTNLCGSASDTVRMFVIGIDPVYWYGAFSTDWNNKNNWFPKVIPTPDYNVLIQSVADSFPIIKAVAYCKNIEIQSGASLIDMDHFLHISGLATVNHAPISAGQWHLISSPVDDAVSGLFVDQYLKKYVPTSYITIYDLITPLNPMEGYSLWPDGSAFTAPYVGSNLNSGTYTLNSLYTGNFRWNLVGNPYPSTIDWELVDQTNVNGSIYIEDGGSWSTYVHQVGTHLGSRYIAPTQGFFIQAKSGGGSFSLTPDVQVHHSSTFLKSAEQAVPNLVRLQVSGNGYKDDAVVRFVPEATSEFDGDWDANKFFGRVPASAQLYTLGSTALAINSLPETESVAVGIKIGVSGSYTLAATEINDLSYAYLEDIETGAFTPLSGGSYTFNSEAGTFDQRFRLHFSLTSVEEAQKAGAVVYSYQRTVHINMKDQQKGDIFIYNITGQLIKTVKAASGDNQVMLPVTGNYIVKVVSKDKSTVRKVWIE